MIQLYNRDGADLKLALTEISPDLYQGKFVVDDKHKYVLEYVRGIGDNEAIDPCGGPFLSVGDILDNEYKIVKIEFPHLILHRERN